MSRFISYLQQFGRFTRNARLYLISNALSGVTTGILLVLYNLYLASLGYKADFIGLALFAATIGAGIAIFPAGFCVDRYSGKAILIWSNLLIGAAGIGQILFRQPLPLLVSGFIAGMGFAFILVINAPFLTRNSEPMERPHLFSLNIVLGLVTTVVGSVIGGTLPLWFRAIPWFMSPLPPWAAWLLAAQANPRSFQLSLLFAGAISGPSLIPLFLLREQRRASRSALRRSQPRPADRVPARGTPRGYPGMGVGVEKRNGLWAVLPGPMYVLSLVQVFVGAGAGLFINYFNLYFVDYLKSSSALFGVLNGGTIAIAAVCTLAAPWLAQRIGRVNAIALTQLASIPLLITLGLTTMLPIAALCFLFRQGLMDMSNGVLQVFSMEVVPEQHRGIANSSYQVAFQVPGALTAPLGGLLIANVGYTPIFLGAAACYLLAIGTLWGKYGRGKEPQVK
ncbi:MAG TPA: MFS transporter [Ktedonobacteraceae bacterium]|nr:MFS transporter [Ktedonobacteraceae bacterium]